jgi:hypothetical protein
MAGEKPPAGSRPRVGKVEPVKPMERAKTMDIDEIKSRGFIYDKTSRDGKTMTYRNPDTGERIEITLRQGGPAWLKPEWGRSRIESELRDRGFKYTGPTKDSPGKMYKNPDTGEEIRIMDRPRYRNPDEAIEKHLNDSYYRYRPKYDKGWGEHTTIPDKDM